MSLTRQFGMNKIRVAEPDPQLVTCVGAKNGGGQYGLWLVGPMHLPQVAYVLESRLWFWRRRLEANRHGLMVSEMAAESRGDRAARYPVLWLQPRLARECACSEGVMRRAARSGGSIGESLRTSH
jgi:hypothetical protein